MIKNATSHPILGRACERLNSKQMKRARQINSDTQGDVYVRVPSDN
jgi:hypothetical protein